MRLTDVLRSKMRPQDADTPPVLEGQTQERIEHLPIELIQASQYQPRSEFDDEGLDELAQSIAEHGVLHPIVVRKSHIGYEVVGEGACVLVEGWVLRQFPRLCGVCGPKLPKALIRTWPGSAVVRRSGRLSEVARSLV